MTVNYSKVLQARKAELALAAWWRDLSADERAEYARMYPDSTFVERRLAKKRLRAAQT